MRNSDENAILQIFIGTVVTVDEKVGKWVGAAGHVLLTRKEGDRRG